MCNIKSSTPASRHAIPSTPNKSGSSSISTGVGPSTPHFSLQQESSDTTAGATLPSSGQTSCKDIAGSPANINLHSRSHTPTSPRVIGAAQSSLSHQRRNQSTSVISGGDDDDGLFVTPERVGPRPAFSNSSPVTPANRPIRSTRPGDKSKDRPFIQRVARYGYYEDCFGVYPDVDEEAEGGGIWCSDSEDEELRQGQQKRHAHQRLNGATRPSGTAGGAAIPDRTKPRPAEIRKSAGSPASTQGRKLSELLFSDEDEGSETAAVDFARSKAFYERKVANGQATHEDFVWISGLEENEKKRLEDLRTERREQSRRETTPIMGNKRYGMFGNKPSGRSQGSHVRVGSGNGKNVQQNPPPPSTTPTQPPHPSTGQQYGMFSRVPITLNKSSTTASQDMGSTNFNSAAASGVRRSRSHTEEDMPAPSHPPSRVNADCPAPSTPSSVNELSFGVEYRIDRLTKEVMIPASQVANMALLHHRNGALPIVKVAATSLTRRSSPDDEVSMGIVYRIDGESGEVMIPKAHARNMVLVNQRSGSLTLEPSSQPSPPKRRKVGAAPARDDMPLEGTCRRATSGSRTTRGASAGKKRGRSLGRRNKPKESATTRVGSSASEPVEIGDDSDADDSE